MLYSLWSGNKKVCNQRKVEWGWKRTELTDLEYPPSIIGRGCDELHGIECDPNGPGRKPGAIKIT
jgi:hypothetical protein